MRVFLLLLLLLLPVILLARDVPYLSGRIVDEAGMLSPEARQRIEQKLAGFEQQTGAQVTVLTIASLEGDPLEDFSVRVAETWKLGQQGKDNGAIFLIVRDDRLLRIEVGYGLEPELTDAESGRILDNIVRPAFRNGDFSGGIEQGVDAILAALGGAEVPAAPTPAVPGSGRVPVGFSLIILFVLAAFSLVAVTAGGCQSWFLYVFLMPFYFVFGSAVFPRFGLAPVIAWIVLFPILKAIFGRAGGGTRRRYRSGGGWGGPFWGGGPFIGGGGFGGGFGGRGGGLGGGGFSGGGGRFGGGGASGSW